ncbi:MAG: type II secretion system protein [Nitrosomonadaceae bacterium]|nr:type II secretion system protein [Nitrosomonadaceae bacterium]MDW7619219.1 type II secretion system protein [Nitrosomonadaceae bacterium]MDW7647252.1 type II secretion system protein [Nitrosomonadaceae bacterium]MDW7666075.1 type II secretion system protein [Nitrosomonadaceae bacterium]
MVTAARRNSGVGCGMHREKGFTYIWMLFAVALAGIVLAGAGLVWRTEAWRDKEKELMFVGDQFRQAIGSYYETSPGIPKRYPDTLEKLLVDDRFPMVKRHLRKIFFDPMTGTAEWGLVRQPGLGITGVYSLSARKPINRANFLDRYESFVGAASYKDWKFVYFPGAVGNIMPQPQPPAESKPPASPGSLFADDAVPVPPHY